MFRLAIAVVFLLATQTAGGPNSNDSQATFGEEARTDAITAETVAARVRYLASDRLEGRGAGHAGEALAASYIAEAFALAGLEPRQGESFLLESTSFGAHPRHRESLFVAATSSGF